MTSKKFLAVLLTVLLTVVTAAAFIGCKTDEEVEPTKQTLTAENIAPGVFKQHIGHEDLVNKVVGSYSIAALADYWFQENTLVLTNNVNPNRTNLPIKYKDESTTCRYELIKNMYIANRGFIHYQAYFGTYVLNEKEQTVTLNLPEYSYSYVWVGDNIPTNPKRENYSSGLVGSEGVPGNPAQGFSFGHYNTANATTSQDVRIDLNDNSFSFVSVFEEDDS